MRYGRYGLSYLVLRVSLGLTFLLIGIDILRHPEVWLGYVPATLPLGISRELGLQLSGVFDVVLGALMTVRMFPKIVAGLAAVHLAGVLVSYGIDAVTVRDIGLLGAAVALTLWPGGYRRRWGWFGRRSGHADVEE